MPAHPVFSDVVRAEPGPRDKEDVAGAEVQDGCAENRFVADRVVELAHLRSSVVSGVPEQLDELAHL